VQNQKAGRFRRFLQTPAGRALIPAISIAVVFATYVYVSTLLAIPAILVFSLAVPIWGGLKRPRYLALSGLVVILLVAPIASAAITQEIRTPVGPISSPSVATPNGTGSLLENAQVSPYTGGTGTVFNWSVTVDPTYAPYNTAGLLGISLYISSCPGATGNSSPYCSSGYSLINITDNFTGPHAQPPTSAGLVYFTYVIGGVGIWNWQMGAFLKNATVGNLTWVFLAGDPTYNGIEGPVIGTWVDTFSELLPTVYLNGLLLLALPFFIVLLLYMFFKSREAKKKDAERRAAGSVPPPDAPAATGPAPPGAGPPPASAPAAAVQERTCPNCGAVVYPNETTCWKCGASLSSAATSGAPLPSSRK